MEQTIRISSNYQYGIKQLETFLVNNRNQLLERMKNSELMSFEKRRGSMIIDVVTSRQRKYLARVVPLVNNWENYAGGTSIQHLIKSGCPTKLFGLRNGEEQTILTIAHNFLDYGSQRGISDEDELCVQWSREVEGMRFAYDLDPIVGGVKGIGLALFNYMRMLSNSDALKPDVRIKAKLMELGFKVPKSDISILFLCEAIAEDLKLSLLELDQLLWFDYGSNFVDKGEGLLFLTPESNTWKTIDKL